MSVSMRLRMFGRLVQTGRRLRWTRERLLAHQLRELARLREYVYAHSAFYREFHRGLTDRPLTELPVLTKSTLLEHFDQLVTDPAIRLANVQAHVASPRGGERFLGRYRVARSSGSSGLAGLFVHDESELATIAASILRPYWLTSRRFEWRRLRRVALISSTEASGMSAHLGPRFSSRWSPMLRMDTREPLDLIVRRLNAWQPDVLATYASMARSLAEEQHAGRLRISPGIVTCSAEVLPRVGRRRIEAAWGRRLFDRYSITEVGLLAAECFEHRGMHLLDDLVIVEVVDEENRPVAPGAYGAKVLVTSLFSRTQPLIRYEVSDLLRLTSTPCPCGSSYPLVDDVQGRVWEVLYFPSPSGGEVAVQPLVINNVMEGVSAQWQVVRGPDDVRVLLSDLRDGVDDERLIRDLRCALEDQGAIPPPVRVERVAEIPRTAAGKAPLIRSTVPRAVEAT